MYKKYSKFRQSFKERRGTDLGAGRKVKKFQKRIKNITGDGFTEYYENPVYEKKVKTQDELDKKARKQQESASKAAEFMIKQLASKRELKWGYRNPDWDIKDLLKR